MRFRSAVAVARAVIVRPDLWITVLRQIRVLARPEWWKRAPFLPVPHPDYLRFRMITAYGGAGDHDPEPKDLIAYLEWCRAWPRVVHQP